jgi:hypothetical protein
MGGGTLWQFIATSIILLLILVPWFAFRALGEVIGDETLVRLYFEPRHKKTTVDRLGANLDSAPLSQSTRRPSKGAF